MAQTKLNISLDYRVISIVLAIVILGMLALWRPWSSATTSDRTITVTGEAKVTNEPDEFVFTPSYEFKNADKAAALAELTKKSDEITAKLKSLNVPDNKIKISTDSYGGYYYPGSEKNSDYTYNLRFTITLPSRAEAQKIQDYLVTTNPLGQVSPQAQFSDGLRKTIEAKARDDATKDARSKADQSGKNLGFKVGKVKTITDGSTPISISPVMSVAADSAMGSAETTKQLSIQPGENDLTYTVTVVYYIR